MSVPFRLRVESGPNAGQSYPVAGSGTTIGRQDGNTIVLDDGRLSRQHARLDLAPGGLTITDLGSANGTLLNGQRISGTQPLRPGDRVQLGDTTIVVEGETPTAVAGGGFIPTFPGPTTPTASAGASGGPRLILQSTGRNIPLDRPAMIIGRQPGNDITLEDTQASRQHARFDVQGNQVTITDLGSANGTRINGTPISVPTILREGDLLLIGTSQLRVEGLGSPAGGVAAFGTGPLAPPSDATVLGGPPVFGTSPLAPPNDATVLGGPPVFGEPTARIITPGPPTLAPPPLAGSAWNNPPPPQFGGPPSPIAPIPMPAAAQPRPANRLPLIIAGVVGVLLLCIGGGAVAALALRGRSDTPTATTVAASTPLVNGTPVAGNFATPAPVGTTAPIAGSGGGNPAPPPPGATVAPSSAPLPSGGPLPSNLPVPSNIPFPSSGPARPTPTTAGARPSTAPNSGGAQTFAVKSVGLSFSLPAGWTQDKNENGKATFLSPDKRALIVVRWSSQVSAGLTAQSVIADELDATAQVDPNFDPTAVGTGNVTFGGQTGYGCDVYTYSSTDGTQLSEADRAVVLAGRAQYFFGFSAVADDFGRYDSIFTSIINTIVITGP